jgi:hypothetical protein
MEHQKELSNLQELPRFTYHRRFVSANATMNSSSNRYHQNHKNNMIPKKLHHPKDGITFLKAHRRAHSEGAPQSYLAHDASSASLFWEQPLSNKKLSRFQDNYVLTKQVRIIDKKLNAKRISNFHPTHKLLCFAHLLLFSTIFFTDIS